MIIDEYSAKRDISNKIIKLYIPGGFIGCTESKKDKETMAKYNFKYTCQGCIRMKEDNVYEYNRLMLEFLREKYGEQITKEFRKDVFGLSN